MTKQPKLNYIWKDSEGRELDMMQMEEKHLQYAHTHACGQEFKYHKLSGFFSDKRDELEEVAEKRGIKLIYPDEKHPSPKWGNYFCAVQQTKKIVPTFVRQSSIVRYTGLEQVNVLD